MYFTDEENYELKNQTRLYSNDLLLNMETETLNKIAAWKLRYEYKTLFDWLNSFTIVLTDKAQENKFMFSYKEGYFSTYKYGSVHSLMMRIEDAVEKLLEEFKKGKHPSNTADFALGMLFENITPLRTIIEINSYFQDGNFASLKTTSEVRHVTGKKEKVRYKQYTHEFIIEKWEKDGKVNFKTKAKDFIAQFKAIEKAKVAPKVENIEVVIENKQAYSYSDDWKIEAEVKMNPEKKPVLHITNLYKMTSEHLVQEILMSNIAYHDDKYVVINFVKDRYTGFDSREIIASKCFGINEYGGLQEFETIPKHIELQLPIDPVVADVLVIPKKVSDIKLKISDDETTILDLPYNYFDVAIEHESHRARIYTITNKFNKKVIRQYMAKYDECWVNTDEHNARIIELKEALDFCDTLLKGWDPLTV